MLKRQYLVLVIVILMAAGCQPANTAPAETATPSPVPAATVSGLLLPTESGAAIAGRQVGLCRVEGAARFPANCTLLAETTISDGQGQFTFDEVEPGRYLLVYRSGREEATPSLAKWAGETLRPGDWPWLRDELLAGDEDWNVHLPAALPLETDIDRGAYGVKTLRVGASPLVLGHEIHKENGSASVEMLWVEAQGGETTHVTVPYFSVVPVDYGTMREEVGALSREETTQLDRELVSRWERFMAGDDAAYRDTDVRVIEALRTGSVYQIENAVLTPVETVDDELVKAVGYGTIDVQSGERQVIGWVDVTTGDVIEVQTGYRLNVRDNPGVRIVEGEAGERFWHYGWTYYRGWGQILPNPMATLIEDFYEEGAAHFWRRVAEYQDVARSFGGDLSLVDWDNRMLRQIEEWQPTTLPFVRLPDSGTVDIDRNRFFAAQVNGQVQVDEESVDAFLQGDIAQSGSFSQNLDRQDVIDALLLPYRSGHLFSDMEAAIILDATYGGDGDPLTVVVSNRLDQGFQVPRYRDKVVYVSQNEVANVLLGYPGALNSRWPHEMGHIVDFRAAQYTFERAPAQGSRCEPAKYLMEYMWWVRRYPGDAPDWDWMPINSGLTLSRLLTEAFHNSRC